MTCGVCGGKLLVIDTGADKTTTYRKRKCLSCGRIVWTEEWETNPRYIRATLNRVRTANRGTQR